MKYEAGGVQKHVSEMMLLFTITSPGHSLYNNGFYITLYMQMQWIQLVWDYK